jgi:Zn-dependent protease with chaperone function
MLRHLEGDEVAAIFAHEVAHLEHYTPGRMRTAGWAFFVLIICGTVLPAAIDPMVAQVIWMVVLSLGFALRRGGRHSRETQCDLRAVELCGDPDAFVRALTKLHTLGRVPPRQRSRSRPTLEQRIAAVTSHISNTSRDSADNDPARSSAS